MKESLIGKTALITGAASGIGRATAKALAREGITGLGLLDMNKQALDTLVLELQGDGTDSLGQVVDVASSEALGEAFEHVYQHFGTLSYVHNNVGIMTGFPPFPDTPLRLLDRALEVNLRSNILGTQFAFHALNKSGGGSILNTASGAAKVPLPSDPIYAATKAAINHFCLSCAHKFAKHQIRINTICPGMVDTAILLQNEHPEFAPKSTAEFLETHQLEMLTPETIADNVVEMLRDSELTGELRSVRNPTLGT